MMPGPWDERQHRANVRAVVNEVGFWIGAGALLASLVLTWGAG